MGCTAPLSAQRFEENGFCFIGLAPGIRKPLEINPHCGLSSSRFDRERIEGHSAFRRHRLTPAYSFLVMFVYLIF
jgi:hypothetical protein